MTFIEYAKGNKIQNESKPFDNLFIPTHWNWVLGALPWPISNGLGLADKVLDVLV